ncbi:hypothetical protein AAA799N04_01497 [Marine Group I thaumarchaeote SCGC AAA799-N04]|uniref:Uncharacterized protein n=1 Tax=Marine Group I thaumarchaeote SCGC AAA799-N04 TaxID=1502293 RepID=A0A081RLM8_9ARCH|nr:hypothetical protein AAA799N04_01497 [Marine Group I thaumarchaeote SCGC AAA799-N04]
MKLKNYEFDIEYRWHKFYCENCGYMVHLGGENIEQYITGMASKIRRIIRTTDKRRTKETSF